MLANLKIENIAIIESAAIDFESGLNVLSGETGAGKSIIIDSLSAVLGERTSKELIRTGADKAKVVAVFSDINEPVTNLLMQMDLPVNDDGSLIVSRVINADGRNVCKVNQSPVTVSMLKQLGRELISIHGQHDSQNLLNPECHYKFLDSLGGLQPLYAEYLEKYTAYSDLYRRFKSMCDNEDEREKRIEFLKFEIQEIEDADIKIGEYDELCGKRDMYRNSEKVIGGLKNALAILSDNDENDGVITALFDASKALEKSATYYDNISDISSAVLDLTYALSEKRDEIERALYECEYDPTKQEEVEERLNFLYKLKSKYGETEEDILEYLEKSKRELADLESFSADKSEIIARLEHDKTVLLDTAERLSMARKHTASEFEVKVRHELSFLDMPNVELVTSFERCKLNPTGSDIIEFRISPNVGEALKPLAKIASGGELSRIMLAIQNVLAGKDNVQTMIFDEIDTGVSGSAAEKIAISLGNVAKKRQVLCITHSAQVAAYANSHFLISKEVQNEKTYTRVAKLDDDGRVGEIARIIGGVNVTQLQRDSAREMIDNAKAKL